ncbi:hypothetical protein BJ912DRAFT_1063061 [Pholiota molesta]|nr:hypothetical protein BJ912DRAFT_1063061 [Pholiota molesta]
MVGHLATRAWYLGATAVAVEMTITTTSSASSREAMAPVQMMSMAEMRRSTPSDRHPPKTLDLADSVREPVKAASEHPRSHGAPASAGGGGHNDDDVPGKRVGDSDADDDDIAPFGAFNTAGRALGDADGILDLDDGDEPFGHDENMGSKSDGGGSDDDDDVWEDHGGDLKDDGENTPFDATCGWGWAAGADCHGAPECDGGGGGDDDDGAVDVDVSGSLDDDEGDDGNALLDAVDPAGKVVDDGNAILQLDVGDSVFGRDEDIGSERDGGGEDGDDVRGSCVGSSDDDAGGNAPLDAYSGVCPPPIRDVGFSWFATEYSTSTDSRGAPTSCGGGGGGHNDDEDDVSGTDIASRDDDDDGNASLDAVGHVGPSPIQGIGSLKFNPE